MNMYEWEPVEDTVYPESIMATQTAGMFFDILHVEYDNEGWHGMFLGFEDDGEGFAMVDEQVHPTEEAAQEWCERVDVRAMRKKVGSGEATEEEAAWLAMADEEVVAGDVA